MCQCYIYISEKMKCVIKILIVSQNILSIHLLILVQNII